MLTPAAAQTPAQAETARLVEQARAHFEAGNQHYAAGRYLESIREFQAGYALVPRPNFLVNLGQAYRKLGDLNRAKESYVAYVRALPQNSALRDQALQVLAEIEVQLLQEQKPGTSGPPLDEPRVDAPVITPTPAADLPARETAGKTNYLAMSVAGAGLALAGTGLVFQLRAKNASDKLTSLGPDEPFDPALEKRGQRDQRIGIALLATGGAALATAIVLYLVADSEAESSSYSIRPGGMGLKLSF